MKAGPLHDNLVYCYCSTSFVMSSDVEGGRLVAGIVTPHGDAHSTVGPAAP
jgi:hypothetical protein